MLKSIAENLRKVVNFKASLVELEIIKRNADKYYNGNMSGWIRYAALAHVPRVDEMVTKEEEEKPKKRRA